MVWPADSGWRVSRAVRAREAPIRLGCLGNSKLPCLGIMAVDVAAPRLNCPRALPPDQWQQLFQRAENLRPLRMGLFWPQRMPLRPMLASRRGDLVMFRTQEIGENPLGGAATAQAREKQLEQALRNAAPLARQGDQRAQYAARRFAQELKAMRSARGEAATDPRVQDENFLIPALRRADAAGDVPAARVIAQRIQRLRQSPQGGQTVSYRVNPSDGAAYEVSAPANAAEGQVLAYAQQRYGNDTAPAARHTGGPWERYGRQESEQGPWTRYQQGGAGAGIREAELADGTILEFPADTSDEVIDRTVKTYLQDQSAPQAPKRGFAQEGRRQLGLTARYALEGLGSAVGVFSDPIAAGLNAIVPGDPFGQMGDTARYAADAMGLPQPENGLERVVGSGSRALVSTAATMGAASPLTQVPGALGPAAQQFVSMPGSQLLAATSGGAASQTASEGGAGPGGQALAGIAGGFAPSATAGGLRGLIRGGESGRRSMLANLIAFDKAGAGNATLGQATQGRTARGLEALFARTPGSSGVMARTGDAQQAGMGQRVRQIADSLSTRADPAQAGRAIERGIVGVDGFSARFRRSANALYSEVDRFLPPGTGIDVSRTKAALDSLASPTPGAVRTSQALSSSRIASIRDALDADLSASARGGPFAGVGAPARATLPYSAIKNLRTRLGDLIADSTFATDVPTKQLRQVYAALTEDLDAAARATGNPQAVQAASRANAFYRAGMGRMEVLERVIERNGGPERVFAAATSGTREGATTLRAVLQSLPEDGQKQVAAAVIRRMGRANPSAQDDLGEAFSSERFLTMWNSMAPEAKSALFGRLGPSYVRDLETIARAAAIQRQGAQVFRNPSQTTDAAIQAGTVFSFLTTIGTGNFGTAALIGAGVGAANLLARGMTSPLVVKWLAKQTQVPLAALPAQLAKLKAEARSEGDEEALEYAELVEAQMGRRQ